MITSKALKAITATARRYRHLLIVSAFAFLSMACERQTKEIVITNTAEVKRLEAMKAELELEKQEAQQRAVREERQAAEARDEAARERQMEQEAILAKEKAEKEKQLAEQKRALEQEVVAMASAADTINNVFAADLRSRQGRLQLRLRSLPEEIEEAKTDALYLSKILSTCRQGVVTNIRYSVDGKVKIEDVQTVTLKPDEYVKTIKSDRKISSILTRYNNEMFAFELDKVVEELAYENKRLSTSWEMLQRGKTSYSSKQMKASRGVTKSSSELASELAKLEGRINALEFRKMNLEKGPQTDSTKLEKQQTMEELGKKAPVPTGLYAEKERLKRMLELSSNTGLLGDASSSGIGSNFDLHEKSLRDEYEANVRRAFDNVERTVLRTITDKKNTLEEELKSTQDDLGAIQLILDAHAKGRISRNDMLSLHSKYTNSVSESLSSAAARILK